MTFSLPEKASEGKIKPFKSGFVAIAGQPNTGKSTFLNAALGRKIAIVTPKAQTTRTQILGIYHQPDCQMVFLDTPGIHRPGASLFNRAMVRTAYQACHDVDAVLYFINGQRGVTNEDRTILSRLPHGDAPLFLVLNKVDRLEPQRLYANLQALSDIACTATIPLSALTGYNVAYLLSLLPTHLPEGPHFYPEQQWTDQPETFLAAEIIREKLFMLLQKELPYALAVVLGHFSERAGDGGSKQTKENPLWDMEATILVERDSQKGIVIGHGGSVLKKVGTAARLELERLFGVPIFLKLQVKVRKDWSGDRGLLQTLGYSTETLHNADPWERSVKDHASL